MQPLMNFRRQYNVNVITRIVKANRKKIGNPKTETRNPQTETRTLQTASYMTISILQAVFVIVILAVMVLLLLGINHFFAGTFEASNSDAEELRDEIKESEEVITPQNVLSELVKVRQK